MNINSNQVLDYCPNVDLTAYYSVVSENLIVDDNLYVDEISKLNAMKQDILFHIEDDTEDDPDTAKEK